ncbi:hypothetical protein ACH4U6_36380 [Streptomyces netropsis]|uniref:hypothetical protein n=1 Tax=Streptomyces netropsis TaxID=55404 RepID=UPI00378C3E6E
MLSLVKAFLKAGILTESGALQGTSKGTPRGGILSPLLANVALTALDEHFAEQRSDRIERARRRRNGLANVRLIWYADEFVTMMSRTKAHTEALLDQVAASLQRYAAARYAGCPHACGGRSPAVAGT